MYFQAQVTLVSQLNRSNALIMELFYFAGQYYKNQDRLTE